MSKNNKAIILMLILFIVTTLILGGYIVYDKILSNNSNDDYNQNDNIIEDNEAVNKSETDNNGFSLETETGKVIVTGYAVIKEKEDPEWQENPQTHNYVYFNIIDSNSDDFMKYIERLSGNSYVDKKAIGIGCVSDNILTYQNTSDQYGSKDYQLSEADTIKIIESTKSNLIKLQLEKFQLTYGGEAPTCYSHITNITLVK